MGQCQCQNDCPPNQDLITNKNLSNRTHHLVTNQLYSQPIDYEEHNNASQDNIRKENFKEQDALAASRKDKTCEKTEQSEIEFQILDKMPENTNLSVLSMIEQLGDFEWKPIIEQLEIFKNIGTPIICRFYDTGMYFEGYLHDNQKIGRCQIIWPEGSVYTGYMYQNKANFYGRLIHADGECYEGEFKDGKANGQGTYYHIDGSFYRGNWENDFQHGHGIEHMPNEQGIYEGEYQFGMKHGQGYFVWKDGASYKGQFKENQISGYGTYIWSDGRKYSGEWQNNKMNGYGIFSWQDGKKYIGGYVNDKKEGFGTFEWPDGRKYIGHWRAGKQHGNGQMLIDGEPADGIWHEGKQLL